MTRTAVALVSLVVAAGSTLAASPPSPVPPPASCPSLPKPRCRVDGASVACRTAKGTVSFPTISAFCLSCHGEGLHARGGDSGTVSTHPVDVPYPPPGREGYRPAKSLPPLVRLDRGRLTCLTCHGGDDPATNHISLPEAGSKLCLACHVR